MGDGARAEGCAVWGGGVLQRSGTPQWDWGQGASVTAQSDPPPPSPLGKVPLELQEPVYTDQYAQEHVKPPVTRLLLSAELLCRAWRQALPGTEAGGAPRDHTALLALLAQHGLAPALHGRPVTAADLHHAPLNMVRMAGPKHQSSIGCGVCEHTCVGCVCMSSCDCPGHLCFLYVHVPDTWGG